MQKQFKPIAKFKVVRGVIAIGMLVVFVLVALHANDVSNSHPDQVKAQFTGGGKVATSNGTLFQIDKEIALFTTEGCFCAGNPVQVKVTFYNSSFPKTFDLDFFKKVNATWDSFVFTHSLRVPPIPSDDGSGAYEVGRLPFLYSQTGKDCPIGAVCANGTLEWQTAGNTWGYFLLHNSTGGHNTWVKTSDVEVGSPELYISDITGIAQLKANIRSDGLNWYILAFSVLGLEAVIDTSLGRFREALLNTKAEDTILRIGWNSRHLRQWRKERKTRKRRRPPRA